MQFRSLVPRRDSLRSDGSPHLGFHSLRVTTRTNRPEDDPKSPPPRRSRRWLVVPTLALGGLLAVGGGIVLLRSEPPPVQVRVVSGTPTKKQTEDGALERWRQRELTVHVDQTVERLGPDALAAVERAFSAWTSSGTPIVDVVPDSNLTVPMQPDGVNAVVVAPILVPGHEKDLAITIGFSDSRTGEIVEADVILNAAYRTEPLETASPDDDEGTDDLPSQHGGPAGEHGRQENDDEPSPPIEPSCSASPAGGRSCGKRYDLESIVAHEAGHFFGLGEDWDDGLATMYYCTSTCEMHKRSLELTDVGAMKEVYADGYDDAGEVGCAAAPAGVPRSNRSTAAAVLGLLGLFAGRRRAAAVSTKRPRRR